ncbi:branched-chain amino acid ABC transporter substrate-binding protein [Rhizobium brockwellii]|jgi:branched-chain amino acid transport system substrate-binding protein|uniref:branched-chain amino acid ABC transporter substrate-binding protein n=1 Tax=Rhizobium TaxID=379 RepID=UPI001031BA29|nr:branched-chain amino acid ABC transporter substrate-binding protein [Rhizobium ruizarguesonis]TBA94413.1 branched-chain amino acid ABC transporter substrate-binding protein [Rhizobium ruizarguesonis]
MKSFASIGTALAVSLLSSVSHAEILVGVAGPLTGPSAAVGEEIKQGAEKAAVEINAAGGILGEQITLVYGDDASEPKQGVSVANKFAADGVSFVIGDYNSGVSIPASEIYAENGILQITPGSTNPTFTERGLWNTFRVCGRDDQQGAVAGAHILKAFKGKRVAIINDRTSYGEGIAAEVKKVINGGGVTEILNEGINTGEKDYSVLISRLKQAGTEVIYFGGLYTEAGLILRQAKDQGLNAVMIAGDGITSAEFGQIAGNAAEGTLMTFAPDPRLKPGAQSTVAKFRAGGFEPEAYTLYAYAALEVIKAGIEESESLEPQVVADALRLGNPIPTVIGDIRFDNKGDRMDEDYTLYVWKKDSDGKLKYSMLK